MSKISLKLENKTNSYKELNRRELSGKLSDADLESILNVSDDGKVQLLSVIRALMNAQRESDLNRTLMYEEHLNYIIGNPALTLGALSNRYSLVNERYRQIRHKVLSEFNNHFAFIHLLYLDDSFELDLTSNYIFFSPEMAKAFNARNQTNFTATFMTKLGAVLLRDSHSLVGTESFPNHGGWKHLYLIKKSIAACFDFNGFIDLIKEKSIRVEKQIEIPMNDFLSVFQIQQPGDQAIQIAQVASRLIELEMGPGRYLSEQVILPRTTKMKVWEYAFQALEVMDVSRLGYTAEAIHNCAKQRYPDLTYGPDSLQAAMGKQDVFVNVGKSGHFGLKVWEKTGKFLGGTMHEIVVGYLKNSDSPVHEQILFDYIKPFRDTDLISLSENLSSRKDDRFLLFKGGYWGLKGKAYPLDWDAYELVPPIRFTQASMKVMTGMPFALARQSLIGDAKNTPQVDRILRERLASGEIEIGAQGELIVLDWKQNHSSPAVRPTPREGEMHSTADPALVQDAKVVLSAEGIEELDVQRELEQVLPELSQAAILEALNALADEHQSVHSGSFSKNVYRNAYAILLIKRLRGYQCQICPAKIIRHDGSFYIEAAHITAKRFKGKETLNNIIILCPNCHKTFDYGKLEILQRTSRSLSFLLNGIPYRVSLYLPDRVFEKE